MNPSESRGFLQERFEGFEPEPERDLWPAIESELRYRKRAARIPWPYVGVAASVLIISGALIMLWPREPMPAPYAASEERALPQTASPEDQAAPAPSPDDAASQPLPAGKPQRPAPERLLAAAAGAQQQASSPEEHRPAPPSAGAPPLHALAGSPTLLPLTAPGMGEMALPALRPQALPQKRPARLRQETGSRNQLDVENLSLRKVMNFAITEVAKWEQAPIEVYREQVGEDLVQTYQLDLFKLRITRKSYQSIQP